uniref:Peptidase C1A papain C-terminal domain-containing protein n=1 Tax=viral metagenome TaxID=1070528 RepID=A0A6C0BMZ7_9ZZZZ
MSGQIRLNTRVRSSSDKAEDQFENLPVREPPALDVPREFNGREHWGKLLSPIRDQGSCGSCWAFSTTGALACRFNILSQGQIFVELSAAKMLLCAFGEREYEIDPDVQTLEYIEELQRIYTNQFVCHGNTLADAWRYLYVLGVPTAQCFPASLRSKYGGPTVQELSTEITDTPLCAQYAGKYGDKCLDGTPAKQYRCAIYYTLGSEDELSIQREIYAHGPVTTSFRIYADFYTFSPRSQVYQSNEQGEILGGHAVYLVGWGESPDEGKYWWVANSFGPQWGLEGYFKMVRGVNNCGLEANVVGALPDFFTGDVEYVPRDSDFRELYENPEAQGGGLDPLTGYFRWAYELRPDLAEPDDPVIPVTTAADVSWDQVYQDILQDNTTRFQAPPSQVCRRRRLWRGLIIGLFLLLLVALVIVIIWV